MLLHLGRNNLAALTINDSGVVYDSTGATIHVSSATSTTYTATSTDIGGSPYVMTMEATYPQRATNQLTFRGVASTDSANFAWEAWAISNSTTTGAGDFLNRAQESLGTKTSSQSWQFTVDVTLTT